MRIIAAILFLASMACPALSQGSKGWCVSGNATIAWTSNEDDCRRDGGVFHHGVTSPALSAGPVIPSIAITTATQPKCEDGWTLVASLNMRAMCARELKDPQ